MIYAGFAGQTTDQLVGDRVAHPLGPLRVEEERPCRALADVLREATSRSAKGAVTYTYEDLLTAFANRVTTVVAEV